MESNGPRNRRVTASELKKVKKSLKKAIRKERARREVLAKLHKENSDLQFELTRLHNDRNFPFECC